jgi:hypothetical protein
MRRFAVAVCVVLGFAGVLSVPALAGETGHYVNGVEGIKAATLPPPGRYWRLYNVLYSADKLTDANGDALDVGFDVTVYALVNRSIWVTDKKIWGADYALDVIVPLIHTDIGIDALGLDSDEFGVGDITVEPFLLSWHGPRYDAAFGLGLYIPTGDYDVAKPASPGKDFWTGMITAGETYYFDDARTWSASILARYETHSEKGDSNVTPGDDFHFEWGIGRTLAKVWDVGLTGYCHWQVTDDSGSDVTWDKSVHDKVFAIGPEVSAFVPSAGLFISFRSQWEFNAEDRSEGNVTTLTLTKIF